MISKDKYPPTDEIAFFTVRQIAERWQCSPKHVRRVIDRDELVAHRLGHLVRVSADDLYRYERMNRMA